MLRFIGEVITLESLRSSSVFENSSHPAQNTRVTLLNTAFMTATTTFHTLDLLLQRLQQAGKHYAMEQLLGFYREVVAPLQQEADSAAAQLGALRETLPPRLRQARSEVLAAAGEHVDPSALLDFDSAIELLLRFTAELQIYARLQAAVLQNKPGLDEEEKQSAVSYVAATDPYITLFSGLRSACAFIFTCAFWLYSGWGSGTDAVVLGTVFSSLFASAPSPARVVKGFVLGALLGGLAAFLCAYYLQPLAENFAMLCLAIAPFLLLGGWLSAHPKYGGLGAAMMIFFISYATIENAYAFEFLSLLNGMIGGLAGVGAAGLMFTLIDPADSRWVRQRLARALRLQVVAARCQPLPDLLPRFESTTRDLLQRFTVTHALDNEDDREVIAWLMSVLEIGRAVIHLREEARADQPAPEQKTALRACLDAVSTLFEYPGQEHWQAARAAVLQALALCADRPRMLAQLHLLRAAMLDPASVLANYEAPVLAMLPTPQPPTQENAEEV
jgi:uncharacterized membrane protein YccC